MPLTLPARRAVGAAAAVAALASAFTAGVVAGAGSEPVRASTPPPATGVLDGAAAQIAAHALRPVDPKQLDAAAISGMLAAAGDEWGSWSDSPAARAARAARVPGHVSLSYDRAATGRRVAQITVPSFTRGTGREVREALSSARRAGVSGVVLDLRGDPGGLLAEAVETASAFLDRGPVVSYARRGSAPVELDAVGTGDVSTPLVVLVDGSTASAAEVVAGALQDRGRAVVVGSRTFGKGTVQEPQPLPDGTALELTIAHYATPNGRSLDGGGLVPDIDIAAGSSSDVALRRAVDVLSGLMADSGGRP